MLKNKNLIIMPNNLPWNWTADYLKQTALILSKKNQVIIYDQLNACFFLKRQQFKKYPQYQNINFIQAKYFLPGRRFRIIEKINRQLSFYLLLIKFLKRNKILWFFNPEHEYLSLLKAGCTLSLYDCVDFHTAGYDKEESLRIRKKENILIKNVDYFFVNSNSLDKIHQKANNKPYLLKAQGFCPIKLNSKKVEKPNKKLTLGYVGGINHRLDFILIYDLAIKHPDWEFVFVGPKQTNNFADSKIKTSHWLNKLSKLKNITFDFQKKDRKKLYQIIKTFDLAIIPYNLKSAYNLYSYPMKVFEYLYLGKKVISTPIKELKQRKFKGLVFLGNSSKDWEEIIKKEGKTKLSQKNKNIAHELAINNSWENKVNEILKIITPNAQ